MDSVLKCYPDVDILVVELEGGSIVDEEWLDDKAVVGYDRSGRVVRVEVHKVLKRGLLNVVKELADARRGVVGHMLKAASSSVQSRCHIDSDLLDSLRAKSWSASSNHHITSIPSFAAT